MKRIIKCKLVIVLFLLIMTCLFSVKSVSNIAQAEDKLQENYDYDANILNLYKVERRHAFLLKHHMQQGLYLGGGMSYVEEDGLIGELNINYMLPNEFVIWEFYGGAGLGYRFQENDVKPYISLGAQYIFLFSETKYSLDSSEEDVEFRTGFKFKF